MITILVASLFQAFILWGAVYTFAYNFKKTQKNNIILFSMLIHKIHGKPYSHVSADHLVGEYGAQYFKPGSFLDMGSSLVAPVDNGKIFGLIYLAIMLYTLTFFIPIVAEWMQDRSSTANIVLDRKRTFQIP